MAWWQENIDLSNVAAQIALNEFDTPFGIEIDINHHEHVASYNWKGDPNQPAIVVPGEPAIFTKPELQTLQCDEGKHFVDENHYLMPEHPMDSMFFAINEVNNDLKYDKFDLATDRSNIMKLYLLLCSKAGQAKDEQVPFRIDLHRIGSLVVFVRCEEHDLKTLAPHHHPTHEKHFHDLCTKSANPLTEGSFYEISSLKLGDLSVLMRFGVDCCELANVESEIANDEKESVHQPVTVAEGSNLHIIKYDPKRKYSLLDLGSHYFKLFPSRQWFYMYLSGFRSMFIGWHDSGRLIGQDRYTQIEFWERADKREKRSLHRLYNCIKRLIEFMRVQDETQPFALCWSSKCGDVFNIYKIVNCDASHRTISEGVKKLIKM